MLALSFLQWFSNFNIRSFTEWRVSARYVVVVTARQWLRLQERAGIHLRQELRKRTVASPGTLVEKWTDMGILGNMPEIIS